MTVINEIALSWWQWMGSMLWQASLLILFISSIDVIIRKWAWPQVRYALWLLVLLKLVIPPTWYLPISLISHFQPKVQQAIQGNAEILEIRNNPGRAILTPQKGTPLNSETESTEIQPGRIALEPSFTTEQPPVKPVWQTYAMALWLLGMAAFSLFLLGRMLRLRLWHRQHEEKFIPQWFHELLVQTAMRLKLQRLPAIVFSQQAISPAVYGMFRPVLLLPANYFETLSRRDAGHVLLHELAHLKRGDLWLHGLCLFLQIIYWFNPLMVWVRQQMKHVREICCDLTVANILKEKTMEYRKTLLDTARELLTEKLEPGLGLLGVFEEPFRLVTRLKWLEKKTWHNRPLIMVTAFSISLVITACVLPMAGSKNVLPSRNARVEKANLSEVTDESRLFAGPGKRASKSLVETPGFGVTIKKTAPPGKAKKSNKDETGENGLWAQFLEKGGEIFSNVFGRGGASGKSRFNFEINDAPAFSAVVLPMRGSYDQLHEAMRRLQRFLEARSIKPTGPSFFRQMNAVRVTNPEYEYVWEVGYPVPEDTKVHAPFEARKFPAAQVSSMRLSGLFDEDIFNREWAVWFYENDLKPTGASFIFCPDKLYKPWPASQEWEIRIGIEKWDKPYPEVDIYTKWTEPVLGMVLPMQGPYEQEEDALGRLKSYLEQLKVTPAGDPFVRYFNSDSRFPEDELLWEVGIPVPKEVGAKSPFEIKSIADELVAYTIVDCSYEELEKHAYAFALLAGSKGYFSTGYPGIILRDGKLKGWAKREIRFPIRRIRPNPNKLPTF